MGIPDGTYVSLFTPAAGTNQPKVTLNNDVVLSENDVLYFAPGLDLSNGNRELTTPGIQYLAVYETEPVESLLDIFWETASTGIISDLNNLILNSSDAAGGIGLFTSDWNETITTADNIFTQSVFLVDAFGTNLPVYIANADPALATAGVSNIVLGDVLNLNGINVQAVNPYFALTYDAANGSFVIKPTASYFAAIFFSNAPGNVRIFNFEIIATTTDINAVEFPSTFSIGPLGPSNIAPVTTQLKVRGVVQAGDLPTTIDANRTEITAPIVEVFAHNGAGGLNLRTQDFTIALFSLIDLNAPAGSQNVLNSGFFQLDQSIDSATNTKKGALKILPNQSIPASQFQFVMTAQDAGGSGQQQTYTSIIDLTITPDSAKSGDLQCADQGNVGGTNSYPFVYFEVSGAGIYNGFYVFPTTGINNLISSGNVVTIDYTNAVTSTGGSCPNDITIPFFSANLNTAYNLYAGVGQPCNDCGAAFSTPSTANIDISGYTFEIV